MNNSLHEIGSRIIESNHVLITAHIAPDGDSVGSVLGLGIALESLSKQVSMVMEGTVPEMYRFLQGSDRIISPGDMQIKPDLLIFLDCTDYKRAGEDWYRLFLPDVPVINIDHHISNQYFGNLNFVDSGAAATAEIIWELLNNMNIECSKDMATALYAGIVMDTGSFQYQNTTPKTMRISALLLERGVDLSEVREKLYESRSLVSIQVISLALSHLKISPDGKIAWTVLDKESLSRIHAKSEHCDGVVNYPISISGVKAGLLFREMEDGIVKVGLRCRTGFDVNEIAGHFGGGGHKLAAGCQVDGPLDKAVQRVLKVVSQTLGDS